LQWWKKIRDKLGDQKENLERLVDDTLKWIESGHDFPAEEFEKKQKELEQVYNPIITRIYQEQSAEGGQRGTSGGMPSREQAGFAGKAPTPDEVD